MYNYIKVRRGGKRQNKNTRNYVSNSAIHIHLVGVVDLESLGSFFAENFSRSLFSLGSEPFGLARSTISSHSRRVSSCEPSTRRFGFIELFCEGRLDPGIPFGKLLALFDSVSMLLLPFALFSA
mmetsp:Transcript_64922/g.74641  ORF Transcript_64922/g.74641 Transcript_64922/m.74641 type:complete len:124 (-) Transcript_64922:171-542(-)